MSRTYTARQRHAIRQASRGQVACSACKRVYTAPRPHALSLCPACLAALARGLCDRLQAKSA
jgi:PHP family Zn ribbon phosphoesterase